MNKNKINKFFADVSKKAGLDFSINNADIYGDCQSCVWASIEEVYGKGAKGIYLKHWLKGMNKGPAYSKLDYVYIGHNLTEEQANILIRTAEEHNYDIDPKVYYCDISFRIKEKENKADI